tara:strand:+ start:940 stop:3132 length:2193 start_codon:yes stop_codon:yes gene_type:complete
MARTLKTVITNFSSGELNPLLAQRTDVPSYFSGAKSCKNFALLAEGGIMRRPGTSFLTSLPAESRIIPFIFSDDEVAVIVLSNNRMDVYNTSGVALTANYTTNANWTTAQLFELNFAQFGDTIYVTHRNNPVRKIFRASATSFTISTFDFATHSSGFPIYEPYYKYEVSSTTISTSGTTGSVTVTASANTFSNSWVGLRIRKNKKTMTITGYTSATQVTATCNETLTNTTATADWDEQAMSDLRGYPQAVTFHNNRLWFGGLFSRPASIQASKISEYTNFDVDVGGASDAIDIDISGDQVNEVRHIITGKDLQVFTDGGEYYIPRANDNTITPANIAVKRQTPYGISRTAPQMFDQATGFVQKNGKAIREFIYSDIEDGYKSTTVSILAQHLIDSPKEIAIMKGNLTRPEQYAFFLNNGSTHAGKLSVFHSVRDEKIAGWTQWFTRASDTFQSIAALNDHLIVIAKRSLNGVTTYTLEKFADDDSTTLDCQTTSTLNQRGTPLIDGAGQSGTVVVIDGLTSSPKVNESFTIAGNATEYTIQSLVNNGSGEYSLTLDKTLAATPADDAVVTFTKGFLHTVNSIYTNESVNVIDGNSSVGSFTVSGSDTITLVNAPKATGLKIGFNYDTEVETMPIDKELPEGPLTGLPRRISRAIVDLNSTLDMNIKAADSTSKALVIQQVSFQGGSDLIPVTSKKEFYFLGYDKSPTITISQDDPLPIKILGMNVEVVFA